MIYWPDFPAPTSTQRLDDEYRTVESFSRLFTRFPLNKMFGPDGLDALNTAQSKFLGDCYFIAGIVAFAETTDSLRDVFVIKEANESGIVCMNIYSRGIPRV
jgi:hypothetical protein